MSAGKESSENPYAMCNHEQRGGTHVQRKRRREILWLRRQAACREPPIVCWKPRPLPRPRERFDAAVRPRISRCFCLSEQIHWSCGSPRIARWNGSTIITSKNLYVESSATQYEPSTRSEPIARPTRACVSCSISVHMAIELSTQ